MSRLDHIAVESPDPDRSAAFYERFLGARIVRTEGHPVMAYVQGGAVALHQQNGPGTHIGFRVSEEDRQALRRALTEAEISHEERDHGLAVGLFFEDPDGRLVEAITYKGGGDPGAPL
jgi:catechol 2,3-dioxygenase-like lactoylglutathione lyase family enzyme